MSNKWWPALWLLLLTGMLAWRAQNLDAFSTVNDEGAYLMWAQLPVDGYSLYSQTQAVQPPLFFEWLGLALRLGGGAIEAARWSTLLTFCLLAAVLSWLAHKTGGWIAALTALILLGVAPLTFAYSRLVMAELPAMALAAVAVALVVVFLDSGNRWWLVASGIAFAMSLLIKAINPFILAPIGLLLWINRAQRAPESMTVTAVLRQVASLNKAWRQLFVDGGAWLLGAILPFLATFLIYDPAVMYDQTLAFRGDLRAAIPGSWAETWGHFVLFFDNHWAIWLLALGGLVSSLVRPHISTRDRASTAQILRFNVAWCVWLGAGMLMLAWHTPLFAHHLTVLLPPLILLAAGSVANMAAFWQERGPGKQIARRLAIGLFFVIIAALFNAPTMVKANQQAVAVVTGGREQEALQLIKAVSTPYDFLMGDSQLLIFLANRRTPPPMGDVALVAIKSERQTSAKMIELTEAYQAPAVVQWSLRLPWLPEYLAWVEANYLRQRVWDNDHIIYFGRRIPPGETIPHEQSVRLGESIILRGYSLEPVSVAAGQDLYLKVYWQTDKPLDQNYTVFTQLLDGNGQLVAGRDSRPLSGYFPTESWPPGEIITDVVKLSLPADLPSGEYTLITGMYLLETLERLPVENKNQDYVTLTTVKVGD